MTTQPQAPWIPKEDDTTFTLYWIHNVTGVKMRIPGSHQTSDDAAAEATRLFDTMERTASWSPFTKIGIYEEKQVNTVHMKIATPERTESNESILH